eukprot:5345369-Pyramimonas_sp.AAC.2
MRHPGCAPSARTLWNRPLGPYQAVSSLENSILPTILYGRRMSSVSSPTLWPPGLDTDAVELTGAGPAPAAWPGWAETSD